MTQWVRRTIYVRKGSAANKIQRKHKSSSRGTTIMGYRMPAFKL